MAMAVVEHLKIVYFPLSMAVEGIADAYQIHKDFGVQLKLIQKAICKNGLDVTITAKKIMVNIIYIYICFQYLTIVFILYIKQALTHM